MPKKSANKNLETENDFVNGITEAKAKQLLAQLIEQLDECDCGDELGTEGWRHRFGMESKIPGSD